MMGRDRRFGRSRQAALKTRVGIATAVLVGGGAIGVAAVAATGHSAPTAAKSSAYSARYESEGTALSLALSDWSWSRQASYSQLSLLTQARQFSQTEQQGKTLAVQRGIVVLATKHFLILRSSNGSLHLWLLAGNTKFQNVSSTTAGTTAMTASTTATQAAMTTGNMIPATTAMAGSSATAASLLTPAATPQTVTVAVAYTNLKVTVTVTATTATVSQTATMPATTAPILDPTTFTQSAFQSATGLARGDLALVAGVRSHGTLHAQLVLFAPLSASDVAGSTTSTTSGSSAGSAGSHW
jgi:hypothetical protein